MNLKLALILLLGHIHSIVKCHPWISQYSLTPVYDTGELFGLTDYFETPLIPNFNLRLPESVIPIDNTLLLKNIYENQQRAYEIISDLESQIPCELRSSSNRYCNGIPQNELFFSDYPHDQKLLSLHHKRLKNNLQPNKLGSLRFNSQFFRP